MCRHIAAVPESDRSRTLGVDRRGERVRRRSRGWSLARRTRNTPDTLDTGLPEALSIRRRSHAGQRVPRAGAAQRRAPETHWPDLRTSGRLGIWRRKAMRDARRLRATLDG